MVGKINFAGVKSEFEPVPTGAYEAILKDFKFTQVKNGPNAGADMVNLQFMITEEGEYKNRRLFRSCVFIPEALWAFKRTASALGAEPDWDGDVDVEQVLRECLGVAKLVIVKTSVVDKKDSSGNVTGQQNQVDDVVPADGAATAVPEPATSGRRR